jgi:hypothetical protein
MSVASGPSSGRREPMGEERIEVRRYLDALSRSRWTIAAIVVLMTGIVVVASLLLPDTYRSTTRLVFEQSTAPFGETDEATTLRRLTTTETLLTSQQVLDAAAEEVPGVEDGDELAGKVTSSVEDDANIINISGSDNDPRTAAGERPWLALDGPLLLGRDTVHALRRAVSLLFQAETEVCNAMVMEKAARAALVDTRAVAQR